MDLNGNIALGIIALTLIVYWYRWDRKGRGK
jgi:hypothetical protein